MFLILKEDLQEKFDSLKDISNPQALFDDIDYAWKLAFIDWVIIF
jgi:hypothetical protein